MSALEIEPSIKNVDVDFLMWDIRRNVVPMDSLPNPFIVEFFLTDVPENKSYHWLIFEDNKVDLCHIDHGFNVDVQIEVSVKKLTKAWMGWEDITKEIKNGSIQLKGSKKYIKLVETWLGHSCVAHIKKRPVDLRVS